jgi:hypothetical protein
MRESDLFSLIFDESAGVVLEAAVDKLDFVGDRLGFELSLSTLFYVICGFLSLFDVSCCVFDSDAECVFFVLLGESLGMKRERPIDE